MLQEGITTIKRYGNRLKRGKQSLAAGDKLMPKSETERDYDAPRKDLKTNREAHRLKSVWDTYLKRGYIDPEEYNAAQKLYKIYWGAHGYDVRSGPNTNADPLEYAQYYYQEKLREAELAVRSPTLWNALMTQIITEEASIAEEVGRKYKGYRTAVQARAAGKCLIQSALEILAIHWGFKTHTLQ